MEIVHQSDAIHKEKPDGTRVDYYLQKGYEIHYNEIPPGTVQEWHSHELVEEVVFMTDGELTLKWMDGKTKHEAMVHKGDFIRVENSLHTFANNSKKDVFFIAFKIVLDGKDSSKIFKEDKIPKKTQTLLPKGVGVNVAQ